MQRWLGRGCQGLRLEQGPVTESFGLAYANANGFHFGGKTEPMAQLIALYFVDM